MTYPRRSAAFVMFDGGTSCGARNALMREGTRAMGYSLLRSQSTETLQEVYNAVEDLLNYSLILPVELRIKLETLRADITAVLEDRQDWDDGSGIGRQEGSRD